MFRGWKFSVISAGWVQPFEDAPDAGAGGGGADPSDAGDGSQPSDGDVADDGSDGEVAAAGDDAGREDDDLEALLDDDDDDEGQQTRTDTERLKALSKRHRKTRRQLLKLLPMAKRLKDVDLDQLITQARNYEQLSETIRRSPKLRAMFNGDTEPQEEPRTPKPAEKEETFDEAALPFDATDGETNKWLANFAREHFETRKVLKALQARLDGSDHREQQRTEAQEKQHWMTTIRAAAEHVPDPGVRKMLMNTVASHYLHPESRKKGPQHWVAFYLRELGVNPSQAGKANRAAQATGDGKKPPVRTAATQVRIAEANRNLPRTSAVNGNPAPARSERPLLADIKRKIRNLPA